MLGSPTRARRATIAAVFHAAMHQPCSGAIDSVQEAVLGSRLVRSSYDEHQLGREPVRGLWATNGAEGSRYPSAWNNPIAAAVVDYE